MALKDPFRLTRAGQMILAVMAPSHVRLKSGILTLSAVALDIHRQSARGQIRCNENRFAVTTETDPLSQIVFKGGRPWAQNSPASLFAVRHRAQKRGMGPPGDTFIENVVRPERHLDQ